MYMYSTSTCTCTGTYLLQVCPALSGRHFGDRCKFLPSRAYVDYPYFDAMRLTLLR